MAKIKIVLYVERDSFIVYIKTDHIYKDIAEDVETDLIIQIMNQIDHCPKEQIKLQLD